MTTAAPQAEAGVNKMVRRKHRLRDHVEIIDRLPPDLKDLHLTFITPEGISNFSSDNAAELRMWWLVQLAKLANPKRDYWIVLNKREFTENRDEATGFPIKRLSMCSFSRGEMLKLRADDARYCFNTDARTGEPLPEQSDLIFVDFE
jgi:hypothetical protein